MDRGRQNRANGLFSLWLCFVFAAVASQLRALDPSRTIAQYGHDRWNYQTGLPGTAVQGLFQLPDGYLWLHSGGKLYRFDGVRFLAITPVVNGQVIQEPIRSVNHARGNRLILRTVTRTLFLENGRFSEAIPALHLPDGNDRALLEARDGSLWLGADNHLFRVQGGKIEYVIKSTSWIWKIWEARGGDIWITANCSLFHYINGRIREYPTQARPSFTQINVPREPSPRGAVTLPRPPTCVLEDHQGTLWVGTLGGLWKLKNGELVQDFETAPLKDCAVTDLLEDRDGNLWAGTDGQGLFRRAQGIWSNFGSRIGLSDDSVLCLREDREGSLWIGTRTGLDRLRVSPLYTITGLDGLSNDNIGTVIEARDGSVYAFTTGGGITRIKHGQTTVYRAKDGLAGDFAGCLYEAKDGSVWAGTDRGLSQFRGGKWKTYSGAEFDNRYISAICEDDTSLILGCSDLNFYRFLDGHLRPYDLQIVPGEGFRSVRYACQIYRDSEGTLWFAMSAGLYKVPRGCPPEKAQRTGFLDPARSIYDDGRGYLWVAGPDVPGFTRMNMKDGSMVRYTPEIGAAVDGIGHILCDGAGNLWINTRSGIATFQRSELDAFAEGRVARISMVKLGSADGLRTEDCGDSGVQPNACRGLDGRLYIGSRKGLVVVQPDQLPRNTLVPPVHIEEVVVDHQVHASDGQVIINPGYESLEIHYTALSLLVPTRVSFRYQLVGYDSEWVEAGSRRTAYYTRIPPGVYQFRVIACNNDGAWNETGAVRSIVLRPRFVQTRGFVVLACMALAAFIYGLYLLRTRQLRKRQLELRAVVDSRTRELQEEIVERSRAQEALNTYKGHLEHVVAERTAELSLTNKHLEKEIADRVQGEEALRRSEDRYRRFFEEDVAGAFMARPDGRLLACNPSFAKIIGLDHVQDAVSLDLFSLFRNKTAVQALIARIRAEGKVFGCEFQLERTNGRPVHILANIVGQFDAEQRLIEIKGYVLDTTERKDLEEQLRQSQKMEAIGQLAGGVAHDFNNLLTAIMGCSELLLEQSGITSRMRGLANEIREAGERAAALTRQLLAFSRRQVMNPKNMDLSAAVAPMEKMLRRLIGEHIQLTMKLAEGLAPVKADPTLMEQVVLNLVVNARDAMLRGGQLVIETSEVLVSESDAMRHVDLRPGAYVRLSVQDTGVGIKPEVMEHIFEPFFTTKGTGKGTGLGLSTVYGIVRQSDGHIVVESVVGEGTAFHVYLPPVEASADPSPLELTSKTGDPFRGQETVLLVEDDDQVRELARCSLESAGYRVLVAPGAHQALALAAQEQGSIELLLTDVVMPGMNGRELAEQLCRLRPEIRIIFMSGYTDDVLAGLGSNMGTVDLVDKPFTPKVLLQRVRSKLDA